MVLSLALLLSICASESSQAVSAPTLPKWPVGLPSPMEVPSEGLCEDRGGIDTGPGVFLPMELAGATHERLLQCDALPGRCQIRLDAWKDRITPAMAEAAFLRGRREGLAESSGDLPWLGIGVLGVGLAGLGFVAGLAAGL